jgi:hypothetical protein
VAPAAIDAATNKLQNGRPDGNELMDGMVMGR